jgi:hypothetical protein
MALPRDAAQLPEVLNGPSLPVLAGVAILGLAMIVGGVVLDRVLHRAGGLTSS